MRCELLLLLLMADALLCLETHLLLLTQRQADATTSPLQRHIFSHASNSVAALALRECERTGVHLRFSSLSLLTQPRRLRV